MNSQRTFPIVVYDNRCYLCVRFAQVVNFLSRRKLSFVGHYSPEGEELRKHVLGDSALDMFWLVTESVTYGGRAALIPLIRSIIFSKNKRSGKYFRDSECNDGCKNRKAVFVRSASLILNSKKIHYKSNT